MNKPLITSRTDWTIPLIEEVWSHIEDVAVNDLGLTYYQPQIELVSSEQMLDAYSSVGMPVNYSHWSFGKDFLRNQENYKKGAMNLAYEMIIQTNPAITYLMAENDAVMQALVLAHACVSGDTEYLSPTGWKRIDQYDGGLVAQYNKDGTAEFVKPSAYIVRPQDDFIYINGKTIQQKVTRDHRVVFINPEGNLIETTGQDVLDRQNDKTRGFNGKFITAFDLKPNKSLNLTDDEIRLHVAIKADGSYHASRNTDHFNSVDYQRIRFHLKKDRKIVRLRELLTSLGIDYIIAPTYDGRYSITFNYPYRVSKRFDADWYNASANQLKVIADEVLLWDGSVTNCDGNFCSEFKEDVEFVQYVWASTGWHTRVFRGTRAWNVNRSRVKASGVRSNRGNNKFPIVKSDDGKAYCFTVPSSMFIMKMNDCISVTGNCCGHGFVFKNNYLFTELGVSDSIVDYMIYARDYIHDCEEKHGEKEVERLLDCAHSLAQNSIDKYERKYKKPLNEEETRIDDAKKANEEHKNFDAVIHTTTDSLDDKNLIQIEPDIDEENLLYFIAKNSPTLEPWQKEIITIVRRIRQALYPQMQTKLLHEGFATFAHVYIMNELEKRGVISPDAQISWIHSHSGVTYQADMHSRYYNGQFNPYSLGSAIFNDIRRICENPTDEDKEWFPDLVGKPWRDEVKKAASSYNDESFVAQFLSPTIMRKYKMMLVHEMKYFGGTREIVTEICDDVGYKAIRRNLSDSYNLVNRVPDIVVTKADMTGDRELYLEYHPYHERSLDYQYEMLTLASIRELWGYPVHLLPRST